MKKGFMLALMIVMALCLQVPVLASIMYANSDYVLAYAEQDTRSEVLRSFSGGDQVLVETISDDQQWVGVLAEDPDDAGQTIAWIPMSDLSYSMPTRYCTHEWSEWTVYSQPTCTQKGRMTHYCSICGLEEAVELDMVAHSFGNWTMSRQATCTTDGEMVHTCTVCGYQERSVIDKTGHTFGDWVVTTPATCTAQGERVRTCKSCGVQEHQALELLPHSYGDWSVTKEPTCTQEGISTHRCQVCGYEESQALAMIPHTPEWRVLAEETDHSAGTQASVCQVCGLILEQVTVYPEGTLKRGDMNDEVKELQQLLVDQNYLDANGADGIYGAGTETALIKFQTDQGLTPDGIAWPQTRRKLRHDFNSWVTTKKMPRDGAGERERSCKDCSYVQHETVESKPFFAKGDRGEGVKALQRMLSELGADTGSLDGIYGTLLDTAFAAFAKDKKLEVTAEKITPSQVDALTNAWIAAGSKKKWMGEGDKNSPIRLSLTITPETGSEVISVEDADVVVVSEETKDNTKTQEESSSNKKSSKKNKASKETTPSGKIITYQWELTNEGSQDCTFVALLLKYGSKRTFRKKNIVMALDHTVLKAGAANKVSGTFSLYSDWGEGEMNFSALGIDESTGDKWLSNIEIYNLISQSFFA